MTEYEYEELLNEMKDILARIRGFSAWALFTEIEKREFTNNTFAGSNTVVDLSKEKAWTRSLIEVKKIIERNNS